MIRLLSATFCVVITVSSATDVFIIDTKQNERSPQASVSVDKLRLLQNLLGTHNSQSASDAQLLNLLKPRNRNTYEKRSPHEYRLFRNMYGIHPKKLKTLVFKKSAPIYDQDENDPFIKFLLSKKIPQLNQLEEISRDQHSFSDDYVDIADVGRVKPSFSQDYIDFRNLRSLRKNEEAKEGKPGIRTYSVESDREDTSETHKSKRFEIIKNKHNKKDIKSSESGEAKYKKKKAKFKKSKTYLPMLPSKKKKNYSSEEKYENNLSAEPKKDSSKSGEYAKQKSKKKKKFESAENDEWGENKQPIELYLQGNKLVMYPPMEADPSSGEASDNTRRMRMPYFLPKRYHWHPDEIHQLGYFFFNGPQGFSNER